MFHHPKYYAALRAEYRKLQASSPKPQAPSLKHQASSAKLNEELEGLQRYVKNTKQPI